MSYRTEGEFPSVRGGQGLSKGRRGRRQRKPRIGTDSKRESEKRQREETARRKPREK